MGSTANQGAYYIWTPASTPLITVQSNKTWNGTLSSTENGGVGASASLTLASGALRYTTSAPATYAAAAAGTAIGTSSQSWASNVAKGVSTYTHYYALRVDWDDDPGTFSSTVTYTAIQ